MPGSILAILILGGGALALSCLLTLQAWEARRFIRSRLRKPVAPRPADAAAPEVLLVVPCKGQEQELLENLRAFLAQDYGPLRVRFVVESADDPACVMIQRAISEAPRVAARLVVAGIGSDCGQKVHNLLAATADLPDDVEILAFVDSDARPPATWLSTIVGRLAERGELAVTGYRWFAPRRNTLANLTLASINASVAGLFGPGGHHLVWGGAWAVRRDVFEATALREAWRGTLSDDLVASRVLRGAGVPVRFEPVAMAWSPLDVTWKQALEFLRRQFLIGRCYAPRWWLAVLAAVGGTQLALWSGLVAAIYGAAAGTAWWPWPLGQSLALYALGMFRGWLRQDSGRRYFPARGDELAAARRFDMVCGPLAAWVTWVGLCSSIVGRVIAWRGVRYRIDPGGRILLLGRRPNLETFTGRRTAAIRKAS